MPTPTLSVVIPTLNVAGTLASALACLGGAHEIVVSDGGSTDATAAIAAAAGARVITAPRGRGSQLAAGVQATGGDWLLLLHADTHLDREWRDHAERHMARDPGRAAYFRFALDSDAPQARRIERVVAWRCRRFALPYGDQGLLISRALLDQVGGVRPFPLMEDVELARRLGRDRLMGLQSRAITSACRYERDGWIRRPLRNLTCLSLYLAGMPPRLITRLYG